VNRNAYLPTYLRYIPGIGTFQYTYHVQTTQLSPLQLMLNTPTKSSTNILGYGRGRVCSAGWMVCFGTPSGICPAREQNDCVNLRIGANATTAPYDDPQCEPLANRITWALVLESLTPMAFSWHSENNFISVNHHRHHP
jgi:hypothetical protein